MSSSVLFNKAGLPNTACTRTAGFAPLNWAYLGLGFIRFVSESCPSSRRYPYRVLRERGPLGGKTLGQVGYYELFSSVV
jgi:hypothetical protein